MVGKQMVNAEELGTNPLPVDMLLEFKGAGAHYRRAVKHRGRAG